MIGHMNLNTLTALLCSSCPGLPAQWTPSRLIINWDQETDPWLAQWSALGVIPLYRIEVGVEDVFPKVM